MLRLPEVLAGNELSIDVFDYQDSPLAGSSYVSKFHHCPEPLINSETGLISQHLTTFLVRNAFDFFIYSSDGLAMAVKDSDLEENIKERVLPVQDRKYFDLIGSKIALSLTAASLGLTTPGFEIAADRAELEGKLKKLHGDYFVKADVGGGGARVKAIHAGPNSRTPHVPKDWFPLLVQEKIVGEEIAVDALFLKGKLMTYAYSVVLERTKRLGPSTRREFRKPLGTAFEAELQVLAKAAKLSGFANLTFIRGELDQEHYLIEADLRPNTWHQFGRHFGIDWGSHITNPELAPGGSQPFEEPMLISLYPRALKNAVLHLRVLVLWRWVTKKPETWQRTNRLDAAVNRHEARSVIPSIRKDIVLPLAVGLWLKLPAGLSAELKKLGIRRFIARALGEA